MEEAFLDTNVLVYAIDRSDPRKRRIAKDLIAECRRNSTGWLSTQVLGEFYRVATMKLDPPLSAEEARQAVLLFAQVNLCVIELSTVDKAMTLSARFGIGYHDALILAAAGEGECQVVYSEDLQDGQIYDGVTVRNPFKG